MHAMSQLFNVNVIKWGNPKLDFCFGFRLLGQELLAMDRRPRLTYFEWVHPPALADLTGACKFLGVIEEFLPMIIWCHCTYRGFGQLVITFSHLSMAICHSEVVQIPSLA